MIDVSTLRPRRHDPPPGWSVEVFEAVVDALAVALVTAYRRQFKGGEHTMSRPNPTCPPCKFTIADTDEIVLPECRS